jgi:hypothetical protein
MPNFLFIHIRTGFEFAFYVQRKSIYEEGELKAQKFHLPQKPLKSPLAQT